MRRSVLVAYVALVMTGGVLLILASAAQAATVGPGSPCLDHTTTPAHHAAVRDACARWRLPYQVATPAPECDQETMFADPWGVISACNYAGALDGTKAETSLWTLDGQTWAMIERNDAYPASWARNRFLWAHEVGHALGLAHTTRCTSVMRRSFDCDHDPTTNPWWPDAKDLAAAGVG